jgi:hypothetical protein
MLGIAHFRIKLISVFQKLDLFLPSGVKEKKRTSLVGPVRKSLAQQ